MWWNSFKFLNVFKLILIGFVWSGIASASAEDRWAGVVDGYSTGAMYRLSLQRRGYKVVHIQSSDQIPAELKPSFEESMYDDRLIFDPSHPQQVLELLRKRGIRALFTGTETGIEVGDWLATNLGLPSNGTLLSRQRRDKVLMHEELVKNGINSYRRIVAASFRDAESWVNKQNIPFPVITKPRAGAGSQFFKISKNWAELKKNINATIGKTDLFGTALKEILVEEYLSGREFAVNGVVSGGEVFFSDVWEYFKEPTESGSLIYDRDVLLPFDSPDVTRLIPYIKNVLSALGFKNSAFHAEVKWVEGRGALLLEVAARAMGSSQPKIVELCTGTNQIELHIDAFLDPVRFREENRRSYQLLQHGQVVELANYRRGWVKGIPLLKLFDKNSLPSYSSHKFGLNIGDWAEVTEDILLSHPGTVFLTHPDPIQIENDYRLIRQSEKNNGILVTRNPLFPCRLALRKMSSKISPSINTR